MSRPYQYHPPNKTLNPTTSTLNPTTSYQSSSQFSHSPLPLEPHSHTIESLKSQLKQKQFLISQLSTRLQEQQRLLQQKQFALKQKILELDYIHKENEELHQKIFQLNQRLHTERADLKETIKQEVSMLKEEFNFMIKQNQTKNQIILEQKSQEFLRKEEDLKAIIKELSERGSQNGSFFYDDHSHLKSKHTQSYLAKNHDDFYQNQQEKPSTANSILKNSRQTYKSNAQEQNKILASLRESIVGDAYQKDKSLKEKEPGSASVSSFLNLREGGTAQNQSQVTGRFGFVKTPITSKLSVRRFTDDTKDNPISNTNPHNPTPRQTSSRASSRPNIDEIISRSKRQLNERSKKSSMTELPKHYPPLNSSVGGKIVRKRMDDLDNSRSSMRIVGIDQLDEKRKVEKLKEISSLKMKVNMLKSELKEEISFCQNNKNE